MVTAGEVKNWLSDGQEIAFFDVREIGPYSEGHPFFATPLAYSTLDAKITELAPRRDVRIIMFDDNDGVAELAATRAEALGYTDVRVMEGGAEAWEKAGYSLFDGVNLPSKTFGELLELERHTPRRTAGAVAEFVKEHPNHVIVDGRTWDEYTKFNIPGGISCPNGELALRIAEIAPDPDTTIIVNCAGRTRSILGAQTLIDLGVPNDVFALENGTQGWFLAGLEVERGADRKYPPAPKAESKRDELRRKSRLRAERTGVTFIDGAKAQAWLNDDTRTTYLFDVRTPEEFEADGVAGSRHAPGGQLVQATDHWVGVWNARIIVMDDDMIRAPMVANWLYQLGHDVVVLEGGIETARALKLPAVEEASLPDVPRITAAEFASDYEEGRFHIIDVRPSMAYREAHLEGAKWSIRPKLHELELTQGVPIVVVADDEDVGRLAAQRLGELGHADVSLLMGAPAAWRAADLTCTASPNDPADDACIDFVWHTYKRNAGDRAAAEAYIAWEIGLVERLDEQERKMFRIAA